MSILLHPAEDPSQWLAPLRAAIDEHAPGEIVELYPDVTPSQVEFVVAWKHPASDMARYPNLKAILSTGAGIEQYLSDDYPAVPVVRLADAVMGNDMALFALHWVIHFHRGFDVFAEQQSRRLWEPRTYSPASEHRVGILGFGTIGGQAARLAQSLGYPVNAWSRTGVDEAGVTSFRGRSELASFLAASDSVVNVLPSTPETRGLMGAVEFGACRPNATFINIGRGATVDEAALVAALDAGHLGHAVLDVTEVEPLPPDSPLWNHASVRVTPHVSGRTQTASASVLIAKNIARIRRGETPYPVMDRERGY